MSEVVYRFSGHESFPCRYAWIPKAVEAIAGNPEVFGDIEEAMVKLGLGKNMVQSLRFWVQAMRVAESAGSGLRVTEFGQQVFGAKGLDPYLETLRLCGCFTGNCVRIMTVRFSHGIFCLTDFTSQILFGPTCSRRWNVSRRRLRDRLQKRLWLSILTSSCTLMYQHVGRRTRSSRTIWIVRWLSLS